MSGLIDRQAAIDICNNAIDLWHGQLGEGIVIAVKKKIEELPSAQPEKHTQERTETHACDLIDRQAAIDAILAVTGNSSVRELYEHVQEHGLSDMWSGGVNAAIDVIIAVPSAQPDLEEAYICGETEAEARYHAEIVRCKDCKYYQTRQKSGFLPQCCWFDVLTKPNDFCSNGRKENR